MKNVLKALSEARKAISDTKMKKEGRNTYSKYDYFTPSQVHNLVENACQSTGLLAKFDLNRDELGYFGELIVYHIATTESLSFKLVTDVPEIKATNASQKLGGMMTYTERYLKSSAFGIVDNNLDFDAQDNRPKSVPQASPKQPEPTKSKEEIFKDYVIGQAGLTDALRKLILRGRKEHSWDLEKVWGLIKESGVKTIKKTDLNGLFN